MAFDPYLDWLQIPPDRRPADFYALLDLSPLESDPESIRQAGIRRTAHVRKFCLGPRGADATRILGELANAFACLADPERKQAYDESLRAAAPAAAVDDPRPKLSESAPPLAWRPFSSGEGNDGEIDGEAMPNGAATDRRRRLSRQAGASYWSFRWGSRKRSRRQAALRKTALLTACCALLTTAIVVAARAKSLLPDQPASIAPAAVVTRSTSDDLPKAPVTAPLRPESEQTLPETAGDPVSDAPEAISPSAAPAPERPEEPAPEEKNESPPPQVAQSDLPATSDPNRAPAAPAVDEPDADGAIAADAEKERKRTEGEQDELAQEKLNRGLDALNDGELTVAVHNFSKAILAADYRDTDVTNKAAGLLSKALGELRDKDIRPGITAREGRGVLNEFRNRLKRAPRRPRGER